jgi:hypothetical protein
MQRVGVICGVLYVCGVLVPSGADACKDPRVLTLMGDGTRLRDAVIRFEIFEVKTPGLAEAIEGQVDLLVGSRWVPVRNGNLIGNGARLWIAPCAKLVVRFSLGRRLEFQPHHEGRWVLLQGPTPQQHDT